MTRLELSRRQKIRNGLMLSWILLFPVTLYYFSPYLPFAALSEGIIPGSLLLFGLLFFGSLVGGRLFCAWLCPAGAILHVAAQAQTKDFKRRPWHLTKYILWFPWAAGLIAMALNNDGPFNLEVAYQTDFGLSVARPEAYVIYGGVVILFLGLSLIFGRRAACHTICWMAPFMIFGRSFGKVLGVPRVHLVSKKDACVSCGACSKACPMSLEVQEFVKTGRVDHYDCILCARCADTCPQKLFKFSFSKDQKTKSESLKRPTNKLPAQNQANATNTR